ncbi:MAG: hypothetical protein ABWX94_01130 [Candidatus Saccharimonadales bacterium]
MPEQEFVRVEVTTTLFVDPNRIDSPEWRDSVRETARVLGSLADGGAEVAVDLSFDGTVEQAHDELRAERAAEKVYATELAELGEEVLATDMMTLLLRVGGQTERADKVLGTKLKNYGLGSVRAVLAAGSHMFHYRKLGGGHGEKSQRAIDGALASVGATMSYAPSVEDVALFCNQLDEVPGQVLYLPAATAQEKTRRDSIAKEVAEWGYSAYDESYEYFSKKAYELWMDAGLLKRNLGELRAMTLSDLALEIANVGEYGNGADDPKNWEKASEFALELKSAVEDYAEKFTAAKQSYSSNS